MSDNAIMNELTKTKNSADVSVVILAAGQGTRMRSAKPKVLQLLAGKSMLAHVIQAARDIHPQKICVVYGHGGDQVRATFADNDLVWAKQEPQLGTGHAVLQAMPHLPQNGVTLILYGDVPLIRAETLALLAKAAQDGKLAWLTMHVGNPQGLGRIIRDANGKIQSIVEEKDATAIEKTITEINTGFLACSTKLLAKWLPTLENTNAQGEYYLTDILALAVKMGVDVETHSPANEYEVTGVNSKDQLAALERVHQLNIATHLMQGGVTLSDPARVDVRGELICGDGMRNDVTIDVNCIFEGKVTLAPNVKIGANCILRNCTIGPGTEILPFSFIDDANIGENNRIGPYARIRPGSKLGNDVHIGNFVEVKASEFGHGSKANHLTYVGDATVGKNVNIGAGTITCNYDGANKHRTVIEDNVHIGSDVQLVAPVTIGAGADIGAGTTVWRDVTPGGLTLNEKTQVRKADWKRPLKKK